MENNSYSLWVEMYPTAGAIGEIEKLPVRISQRVDGHQVFHKTMLCKELQNDVLVFEACTCSTHDACVHTCHPRCKWGSVPRVRLESPGVEVPHDAVVCECADTCEPETPMEASVHISVLNLLQTLVVVDFEGEGNTAVVHSPTCNVLRGPLKGCYPASMVEELDALCSAHDAPTRRLCACE